jgi:hypothetical protein
MTSGIFISYRRKDTLHVAGRLAGDLVEYFGEEAVFRDVDSIDAGLDFTTQLEKALSNCNIMLVLIGPEWVAEMKKHFDNPQDWVRQEIATAMKRGVRVVPVLVEHATLPEEKDLPPDLKPLVNKQFRRLSDERWRGDLLMLFKMLALVPGFQTSVTASITKEDPLISSRTSKKTTPRRLIILAILALIGVGCIAAIIAIVSNRTTSDRTTSDWTKSEEPQDDLQGIWKKGPNSSIDMKAEINSVDDSIEMNYRYVNDNNQTVEGAADVSLVKLTRAC